MSFSTIAEFKAYFFSVLRKVATVGDQQIQADNAARDAREAVLQAKAEESSQRADAAEKQVAQLLVALDSKDEALIASERETTKAIMAELNAFTSEVVAEFKLQPPVTPNPTLVADVIAQTIVETPAVDTTAVETMTEAIAVGTTDPTPPAVLDAALDAVVQTPVEPVDGTIQPSDLAL